LPVDRYVYEGLEAFEKRLRRVAADVDYLVVWDRTERRNEDPLGRFALTLADALPYLEQAEELVDIDESDPDDGVDDDRLFDPDDDPLDEDTEENEPDDATRAERLLGRAPGPADFAVAAGRWLRDVAVRNMGGDPLRRFRVKAYSPKAARVVETATYACRDSDADAELPVHVAVAETAALEMRIPTPTFDQVETHSSLRGMKALGDYYAQFGHILLGAVGQLQGVNNAVVGRMHRDLQQSRNQVDQLMAAVLTQRVADVQLADQRAASERNDDARTDLARQALQQLGEAARAFLTSKGVSPEMTDLMGLLGQNADLMGALQDPDVRALVQEPGNVAALAAMLKHAASQARAVRDAAALSAPTQT
jgi:hypothetical protein